MNKYLSRILNYMSWALLALLISFAYTRILLGAHPKPTSDFMEFLGFIYKYAFVYMGVIIGIIIAVLYILIDIFYLHRKLEDNPRQTIIRFLMLIVVFIFVVVTHYVLEKVVDVI